MELSIGLAGDVQVRRKLLRIGDRAINAKPAFEAIGMELLGITVEQFSSEGARASGGWADLSPLTVKARGSAHPILDDTGALRRSLTERGGDNTLYATDDFLLFGSAVEYAGFHQTGTDRMPQRRVLELTENDRRRAVRTLQSWCLTGELGTSGGSGWAIDAELGVTS